MKTVTDRAAPAFNGYLAFVVFAVTAYLVWAYALGDIVHLVQTNPFGSLPYILIIFAGIALFSGFTVISPNEAKVLTFFGSYVGTVKQNGIIWTLPFTAKESVPLKLINFTTDHLKVNDLSGNPVEIGAVVVWRVMDAAQAVFNVDNYRAFVSNQSDIAVRTIAAKYPYDTDTDAHSLRGNIEDVAVELQRVLQGKLAVAGIIIEETKLSHLAYAQEVAAAMLKRQQAVAVLQARRYMVENTLKIIDDVIEHFATKGNVDISNEKKAELINSLLVTMTSDKESSPVITLGR